MARSTERDAAPEAGLDPGIFRSALLDWFAHNARDLPWRRHLTPYRVWLSEIMLQQTQMERGVEYFERFTARFPDVATLAAADDEEVLKLWEGLGYYSRARNLLRAARLIVREHDGVFPRDFEAIRSLPGVGAYTAGAIASIAYNDPRPAVDANVLRVFARLLDVPNPPSDPSVRRRISAVAEDLLPAGAARPFNQALMEFGALVCAPRRPACSSCPLSGQCLARARGTVADRPVRKRSPAAIRLDMVCGVLADRGELLVRKRRDDDVWPGLWEFPGGEMREEGNPEAALVQEFREETGLEIRPWGGIGIFRASRTRYRIALHAYFCRAAGEGDVRDALRSGGAAEIRFVPPRELRRFAFPAAYARLVAHLLSDMRLPDFLAGRF